ncbi:tetratricopeptide repeat protein [Kutzneria sp. NPDC051319]|uniref:tetratricopeptide repeat protein n=1 Tax=Kutzneria sp. NPDC051319 TaxID=3155047 RepID=UPI0034264932
MNWAGPTSGSAAIRTSGPACTGRSTSTSGTAIRSGRPAAATPRHRGLRTGRQPGGVEARQGRLRLVPRGRPSPRRSRGHHNLGQHEQAVACYRNALVLFEKLGSRHPRADTSTRLGDTNRAADDEPAAHHTWRQALPILDDLHHPDAEVLRARLRKTHGVPAGYLTGTGRGHAWHQGQ